METELCSLLLRLGVPQENVTTYRWIIITVGVILLFYLCGVICRKVIIPSVEAVTRKTSNNWDDILLSRDVIKSGCNLAPAVVLTSLIPFIIHTDSTLHTFIMKVCWVYITIAGIRFTLSFITALNLISHETEKMRNHTLKGVFQMLKITVMCIGGIIIISTLIDKDPVKILAGLGASAAILMLVFKDSIMGLVAGVQLSANDMLRPGDWITMPKYGADGHILDVTLTTVKIQNWDKTIVTVPPYAFVSDSFQNWRGMFDYGCRRVKRSIFIDVNSISFCSEKMIDELRKRGFIEGDIEGEVVNLTLFRNYLEAYLSRHKDVKHDIYLMVRQLQPTPQGIPVEIYFFSNITEWVGYEHVQAEIFEYIFAIIPQFGLRMFQSPSGNDFNDNKGRIPRHLY